METQTSGTASNVVIQTSKDNTQKWYNFLLVISLVSYLFNGYIIINSSFNSQKSQYEFKIWSKDMDIKEMKLDFKEYLRRQGLLENPSVDTKLFLNKMDID